jgi:putative transposase
LGRLLRRQKLQTVPRLPLVGGATANTNRKSVRTADKARALSRSASASKQLTCFWFSGPRIAGKFQFSGTFDSGRWTRNGMKRSKFTEAQIAFILQQAEEGTAVGEVCRKAGISESTFYYWRKKYAGLIPSEMKRLHQLEEENGKLKKIVADLSLDKAMLQDVNGRKF